jgi:pimeloyl-ACP methyl ester carboxylesterase
MKKIVFIHGAGGCGALWHYQAKHFPDCDAVTLPGHPGGPPCGSVDEYRQWLRGHVTGSGYGRVVMAGHSMGGAIALSYALAHPEDVAGLVLIGTGARLRVNPAFLKVLADNIERPPSWYREIVRPMYGGVDGTVLEGVLDRVCAIPVSAHLNDFLCCDRFDIMDRIPEIKTPVLLLCGDKDVMTPVKYTRYLADRIPGSRMVVIPGAGHMVFLEKPDEVNREIEAFVGGL